MIGYKDLVQYLKEQVGGNLKSFCPIIYSPVKFFDLDPSALPIVNRIRKMVFIAS